MLGNLKINNDGSAQFVPKLVGNLEQPYLEARAHSSSNNTTSAQLSALFEINRKLEWESLDVPCPYTLPGSLLPAHTMTALIEIYFKSVHAFLPLFHKTSFMALFHQNAPGYRVPPFLLMAMCAVALRHATEIEIEVLASKSSTTARHLLQHDVLFDYARALLDTYIDVPRLSTVKGLLLLTYYQIKEKRARHFFRMRTYLGLAVRMSLDMGLARDLYSSVDEVEAAHASDSDSTVGSLRLSFATLSSRLPNQQDSSKNHRIESEGTFSRRAGRVSSKTKYSAEQQEGRLTWLACIFLDSITAGFLGLDFCVTDANLEMRKLIREANHTPDTTQGATLIFWYLHLDLAQLYRRICEMYRSLPQSSSLALSSVRDQGNRLMARSSILGGAESKRTQTMDFENAKGLYVRTMDLLKGYVSLAGLSELKKATTILEQMVVNYLMAPKEKVLPETLLGHTAYSILQQRQHDLLHQQRQQPQSLLQRQDHQRISHEDPSSAKVDNLLDPARVSPKLQTISLLTQKQLHIGSQHESQHAQQNLAPRTEDTQMFLPLPQNAGYSTFVQSSPSVSTAAVPANFFHSFPIQLIPPQQTSQASVQTIQQQQSPLSSFLYDMDATPPSMSLYDADPTQDMFTSDYAASYAYFQQQQPQPQLQETSEQQPPAVEDLLDLGAMGPPSNPPSLSQDSRSSSVLSATSHPSCTQASSRSGMGGFLSHFSIPPPKPPKRILTQFTGSTNSSSRSQSQRPSAPKKPSRLKGRGVVAECLASTSALTASHQSSPPLSPTSSKSAPLLHGSIPPPPSLASSQRQRPFRTLQAQGQLYGHGTLKSSLHTESDQNRSDHALEPANRATQLGWSFTNMHGHNLQHLRGEE
ncbi:hypothetical protein EC968_005871 [Mortierella alpina]|nr:hypothetical protein EC968_005871 [Mortierella alpina]